MEAQEENKTEQLPAILDYPMTLSAEFSNKLAELGAKWQDYAPVKINDAGQRELEYKDFSLRKKIIKSLESKKKIFNQPAKDLLAKINNCFDSVINAIESANIKSQKEIVAYDRAVQERLEATRRAQQAIEDAAAAAKKKELEEAAIVEEVFGNPIKAEAIAKQVETIKPVIIGIPMPKESGVRKIAKFRILDASLIPAEYMIPAKPDEVKIGKVVKALSGKVQIAGVEIYFDETLAGAK